MTHESNRRWQHAILLVLLGITAPAFASFQLCIQAASRERLLEYGDFTHHDLQTEEGESIRNESRKERAKSLRMTDSL